MGRSQDGRASVEPPAGAVLRNDSKGEPLGLVVENQAWGLTDGTFVLVPLHSRGDRTHKPPRSQFHYAQGDNNHTNFAGLL